MGDPALKRGHLAEEMSVRRSRGAEKRGWSWKGGEGRDWGRGGAGKEQRGTQRGNATAPHEERELSDEGLLSSGGGWGI